jgi:hypothetical protein
MAEHTEAVTLIPPNFILKLLTALSLSLSLAHTFHTLHYKNENIGGWNEMEWENEVK